ncbi:tumor protein p53-inducible nuclear protein 2 isoform X3 [Pygocentrus nattereri]|uniref:Tumor protein p53 inducible nuclear protein 2 n=1 Tax=Pygocentrus nattereri TaxID=42514 RepID=A0A3B4D3Y7_PYGNA|nr:tumor protein p53-inducible nuclear protein 2 isoform X3 [Pygocentrus nattereri]
MFQRLSNLLFGEVEDVSAELNGPKPCVTEADDEGWLLVNLPGNGDCTMLGEDGAEAPPTAQSLPNKGATAEASPMEDLLIEHPSMSVYVSPGNLSVVEQSVASLTSSVSRMSESVPPPVVRSSMPPRMARGAACQVVPLAKVTQVSRVQRAKARVERRHLGRNRMQRQNRVREQIPRHTAGARTSFLHQPCQRSLCH